ncbi:MAG: SpoIIE family protein phosphatase [Sphaerochaetaceae bacterium]|nr:SpoIIE family protein phosphatase [Sphaerochaetaceae bacterium]
MDSRFLDIACSQIAKHGQRVYGDSFLSRKSPGGQHAVAVLSDGLGSGIKANVLSTLTSVMALKSVTEAVSPEHTAQLIFRSLPVCSERKINYATFSIVELKGMEKVQLVEYENPQALIFRGSSLFTNTRLETIPARKDIGRGVMTTTCFDAQVGDRIIMLSDGVTQAGLGTKSFPLGWTLKAVRQFIAGMLTDDPDISSRELAEKVTREGLKHDVYTAKDDISCSVTYIRHPRHLILVTGPPFHPEQDELFAMQVKNFDGPKIVCGGTTAMILSRQWAVPLKVVLSRRCSTLPPESKMEGATLVTEGILTLARVSEILCSKDSLWKQESDPAQKIVARLLDADRITLLVGTKINEAHQDPNLPQELDIRRNVMKRIARELKDSHLKDVELTYM